MATTSHRLLARASLDCGVALPPERRGFYCTEHGRESTPAVKVTITRGAECWLLVFACPWCPPRRGQPRVHMHGCTAADRSMSRHCSGTA
jgi:hypothetical protein